MIDIFIGNKKYKVKEAKTEEEKITGLQDIDSLPSDEGMLFYYDTPQEVSFWMKDTKIPLDIVFIDEDNEVISVHQGKPMSEDFITENNVKYVLEININSGIEPGDELEFSEDEKEDQSSMKVLAQDGSIQMELDGGERIFSRKNTVTLIKLAKIAYNSNNDKDYKKLGKRLFKYLHKQDTNTPEYVNAPKEK